MIILEKPVLNANCELKNSMISDLETGTGINSNVIANCQFFETMDEVRWNIILRVNGELIKSISGIQIGNSTTENLTLESWTIVGGTHLIHIEIYDSFGNLLDSESQIVTIPYSNWNIGISSVDISSDNEDLTINMRKKIMNN